MQDAIQAVIEILQYSGIFGLMMVFASELVMPFAGFLAWYGHMSLGLRRFTFQRWNCSCAVIDGSSTLPASSGEYTPTCEF